MTEDAMDYVAKLRALPKQHDFFIGIDSDGCVFDSMEIKHKECFCPAFIKHFGLQAASKYAREVWDFVNLYSRDRGCNRFLALKKALQLIHNDISPYDARIVNIVHDEIVIEVSEAQAEQVAPIVRKDMIQAAKHYLKTVPVEVYVAIDTIWKK